MAINPLIPLAGLGLLGFLFMNKKSSAATPPGALPPPPGALQPPAGSTTSSIPRSGRPTSELSEAMLQKMATALGRLGVSPATGELSGAADADAIRFGTQIIGELESQGFTEAAASLRVYVDKAAAQVRTPPDAAPIAQAGLGLLTAEQSEYVARVLALERNPNKIQLLIGWLKTLSPGPQRDSLIEMAQALALQLESAQATAQTLDQIDQIIKSPGIAEVNAAAQPAPSPTTPATRPPSVMIPEPPDMPGPTVVTKPSYTSASPGLPQVYNQTPPDGVVYSTGPATPIPPPAQAPPPETPLAVPEQPQPQAVPRPLSDIEIVAKQLGTHLLAVQKQYGVKAAKGREDKTLVKKFQKLAGLAQDGAPGPATFIIMAGKGFVDLPLVYYWPKTATPATVQGYKNQLENIASVFESKGLSDLAQGLRASAAREQGQSGINNPVAAAAAAASAPVVPKTPALASVATDPAPGTPTLRQGSKGQDVVAWQRRLIARYGTHLIKTADGNFGPLTAQQTKQLQRDANLTEDGVVGPQTRAAAKRLGVW